MDVPVREVIRPTSLAEAVALLAARGDAKPIAGGTDLMVQLRDGRRSAALLVDLGALDLAGIRRTGEGLEVGAMTPMDRLAGDPEIRAHFPALAAAAATVGAWPIQCRATLGGNLANASPAADTAPALLVADASLTLASTAGSRRVAVAEFFRGPGQNALAPGELIVSVALPFQAAGHGSRIVESFVKVGPRREQVISMASLAARVVARGDGTLESARFALGSVAPTPVRARRAEAALVGRRPDDDARRDAVRGLQRDIAPIDDVRAPARYRRIAAAVLLDRFLDEAAVV